MVEVGDGWMGEYQGKRYLNVYKLSNDIWLHFFIPNLTELMAVCTVYTPDARWFMYATREMKEN